MLFPRLDRPSVVGDDGRPSATSLAVAALVVVALTVATGFVLGQPLVVTGIGTLTGATVAGFALLERERFGPLFVGTLLAVVGGSGLVVWLLFVGVSGGLDGVMLAGQAIALLGVGLTWADLHETADFEAMIDQVGVGYGGILFGLFVPFLAAALLFAVDTLTTGVADLRGAVGSLLLVCAALAGAASLACRWLPIVQLTPRPERSRRATQVDRAGTVTLLAAIGLLALLVPVAVFVPAESSALTWIGSPLVVWPLVALAMGVFVAAGLARVVSAVTTSADASSARKVAAVCCGVGLGSLITVAALANLTYVVLLLAVLVGPLLVLVAIAAVIIGSQIGAVPAEGASLSLASAGLGLTTIAAGLGDAPPAFVFAMAAGTVVVWDVSTYGLGLTAELGHVPDTRRIELTHAVAVLGLAAVAVLAATGLYYLRTTAAADALPGAGAAMALAVVGALLAVLPLRG